MQRIRSRNKKTWDFFKSIGSLWKKCIFNRFFIKEKNDLTFLHVDENKYLCYNQGNKTIQEDYTMHANLRKFEIIPSVVEALETRNPAFVRKFCGR